MSTIKAQVQAKATAGFFRGGKFWPSAPTEVELSQADFDKLAKEPALIVIDLDRAPAPPESETVKALRAQVADLQTQLDAAKAPADAHAKPSKK